MVKFIKKVFRKKITLHTFICVTKFEDTLKLPDMSVEQWRHFNLNFPVSQFGGISKCFKMFGVDILFVKLSSMQSQSVSKLFIKVQ